jgi:hypothetical protein
MKFLSFIFAILVALAAPTVAAIRPSFSLEYSAWEATDIVVATEGETIDGNLQIIEVWKGGLKAGEHISVPELAEFAPETKRIVEPLFAVKNEPFASHVSGSRIALFLKKSTADPLKWQPANFFSDMKTSAAWFEQSKAYAFVQIMNPGPSLLTPLGSSEATMKAQVGEIVKTQNAVRQAASRPDATQRAQALAAFVPSKNYFAREVAFEELAKCKKAALPVLRAMLNDQSLLPQHSRVVEALGEAGGTAVGAELTQIVIEETKFWKRTAPKIKPGWWSGKELQWSHVEALRNRYGKLLQALYALQRMKYSGSKNAVIQLRDLWRSLPQLEDKSGLDQMSQECDNVLKAISAPKKRA